MLTNGIEEYQMTPRDWEGEGGGGGTVLDLVLFESFILATLPPTHPSAPFIFLYLCEKVIVGVK